MWWLNIFYIVGWVGYIYLNYKSQEKDVKEFIWKETPETVKTVQLLIGALSWIILGIYINLSSGYDSVTMIIFFFSQYAYVGVILTAAKEKSMSTIALYAPLFLAVFSLLLHMFLGGTYGWMILIVCHDFKTSNTKQYTKNAF